MTTRKAHARRKPRPPTRDTPRPSYLDELLEELQTANDVWTHTGQHAGHDRYIDGETVICTCGTCVTGRLWQ